MPLLQVDMTTPSPGIVDVPTGVKAELISPAGAGDWTGNGEVWNPPTPPEVDPTPGKDDVYTADAGGNTYSAVVGWKPSPPVKAQLNGGRGNASVIWYRGGDEQYVSYYEVDLKPSVPEAQLPRQVMQGAGTIGDKRTLSLESLPPGFYTARVRAVREGSYGRVSSDDVITQKAEVLPVHGPYPGWVRVLLCVLGAAALGIAIGFLVTDPRTGSRIDLKGWALGTAAGITLALLLLLAVIVRVRDLLTGADNRVSTSRVNVALWTVAIAFGITTLAAFAFGAHQYHIKNPCNLPDTANNGHGITGICVNGHNIKAAKLSFGHTFKNGLAPNYLVLLGVPFAALAGSAFIVNTQISNGTRQKVPSNGPAKFVSALTNDDGSADLVDSQYLIFTGVLLFYFLTAFIPDPIALPDLPWGLVGLTGVSGGTYLLNKSVTANGLSVQGVNPASVKQGEPVRVLGRNFLPEGSAGLVNGGLSISLTGNNTSVTPTITEVSNSDVTFTTADVPQGTYDVQLITAADVSAAAGSLKVS
jgi:hypothetical protein